MKITTRKGRLLRTDWGRSSWRVFLRLVAVLVKIRRRAIPLWRWELLALAVPVLKSDAEGAENHAPAAFDVP
jgi:hypothetical protein